MHTLDWDEFYEHALALGLSEDEAIDYADHRLYMLDMREKQNASDIWREIDDE